MEANQIVTEDRHSTNHEKMKNAEVKVKCNSCGEYNVVLLNGKKKNLDCIYCKSSLMKYRIICGFIYILSNESMPGLIKIGYSERPIGERVNELNLQTGVPTPFTPEAYFSSENPKRDEKKIHEKLSEYRVEKKEFFKLPVAKAVEIMTSVLKSHPVFSIDPIDSKQFKEVVRVKMKIDGDGHFIKYDTGVVYDKKTDLEWVAGPNKKTTWYEAKKWIASLDVAGGGWRMPTLAELKTLYRKGAGSRNMTPLLKTTGWSVWYDETKDSSPAWDFGFRNGGKSWYDRGYSYYGERGFAVRSRR